MNVQRFGLHAARRVCAFMFEPKAPPDRVRLWKAGENPTDYGVHVWNARSVETVWADYQARGVMLTIDIEHGMATAEPGEVPSSAGYARLSMVNGEPWVDFEWSALGASMIESGERRYLSPEYGVDPDTREIVSLTRVSLVAAPGTHHAVILASAKKVGSMNPQDIIDAIRAALAGEGDADTKIATANAVLDGLSVAAGDGSTGDDTADPVTDPVDAAGATETGVAAGGSENPFSASATDEASMKISAAEKETKAAADEVKAAAETVKASAAIKAATDAAVRDVLLTMHGDKLDPAVRAVAGHLPRAAVEKIIASAIQKASVQRNGRPSIGGGAAATGTPLERVRAAAPGSSLAVMAAGMGLGRPAAAPSVNERGVFTQPQRTPSEIRAARAAAKG